ncbi:MAG: 50S ribosomal protein L3 N(5)-glutamine methyltransferase [Gammaproteobacteria bacterium]|nr:50S ribosomal protein L3 N(5)-glutamine methyltransferase [Gammaproteobacteria bacterium]
MSSTIARPARAEIDTLADDAAQELDRVLDLIRWGASRFEQYELHYGHGTDNAVDEALGLVLFALHLQPGLPDSLFESRLTRTERRRVVDLLAERIKSRRPAAYLMQRARFAGMEFFVDERVLVPRSPLAEWIERGFEPLVDAWQVRRVLDLGTGSGCLAIACAMAFPDAEVVAADVSAQALEVADINVCKHELEDRVSLVQSDLFDGIEGEFDLILSNPPYVPSSRMQTLPAEYLHEPRMALESGVDGLDATRRILELAPAHLSANGALVVEVGEARPALERAYPSYPFIWLEFERGGDHVFMIEKAALLSAQGR